MNQKKNPRGFASGFSIFSPEFPEDKKGDKNHSYIFRNRLICR